MAAVAPSRFENVRAVEPWTFLCCDGVAIVQMVLPKTNDVIPQHVHGHDHHTLVARGRVRVWADGKHIGDYGEREAVLIRAGQKHLIAALEDNSVAYCIHNASREGKIEILAEHKLET